MIKIGRQYLTSDEAIQRWVLENTGLRSGEALALTWDNVDFVNKTITVVQNASRIKKRDNEASKGSEQIITTTKTKSGTRQIPLNEKAATALKYLKGQQEHRHIQTNFVIATSNGNMVVQNSFYRIFQNMQKSLGLCPVTIHALRNPNLNKIQTSHWKAKKYAILSA